ncbi:MAG: bifunctional UDP-sugar hydrolase/5'-nucleotidase [Syntrophales bacterium]
MESIRKAEGSVLLLDCGALFDTEQDTAELLINAMEIMGYDALNLGGAEFHFGSEFLARARSRVSFPFVASNLFSGGNRPSWTREYIIKEVGGIQVAILGIVSPGELAQLPNQERVKDLRVIPPEIALARLLPEVRGKAELVILLSRLGAAQTRTLVQTVPGIDVAISSGDDDAFFTLAPDDTVLQTGALGRRVGFLKISLDENGGLSVNENRNVSLGRSVPDNAKVARLVETFKENQAKQIADLEKRKKQELMQGLELSPAEFMERYQREQSEKNSRATELRPPRGAESRGSEAANPS